MTARYDVGYWPKPKPRRPGPGPKRTGRRPFGSTWWGEAWVEALEQRASLDPNRLPRGKTYARQGAVGELDIEPGEIEARVQGSRRKPYEVRVRVRPFSARQWVVVMDALAAQSGHAAALLEGQIPPEIAGDVRSVGLDLLPGAGEVQPRCSCPDWADPCKHSAAVCYLVADRLDEDPFLLFLLRGKSREELMAGVRARRRSVVEPGAASAKGRSTGSPPRGDSLPTPTGTGGLAGMAARDAWARVPGEVPSLPAPPRRPGRPVVLASDPPDGSGVGALAVVAAETARRAWDLLRGATETGLNISFDEDVARWASTALDGPAGSMTDRLSLESLARQVGASPQELLRQALAWRAGGRSGLDVLRYTWDPPPVKLVPGREALGAGARVSHNRVTLGDAQLRLGRDGRWYTYRKVRGKWEPDGEVMEIA